LALQDKSISTKITDIKGIYIYLIDIIEIENIINHNNHYALKQQGYTEDIV